MGGFFGRLLGSGRRDEGGETRAESVEYQGFRIVPAPFREGGQFKTAGRIEKDSSGTLQSVPFIRADNHDSLESAIDFSIEKAKKIIDEQGDAIFTQERV